MIHHPGKYRITQPLLHCWKLELFAPLIIRASGCFFGLVVGIHKDMSPHPHPGSSHPSPGFSVGWRNQGVELPPHPHRPGSTGSDVTESWLAAAGSHRSKPCPSGTRPLTTAGRPNPMLGHQGWFWAFWGLIASSPAHSLQPFVLSSQLPAPLPQS